REHAPVGHSVLLKGIDLNCFRNGFPPQAVGWLAAQAGLQYLYEGTKSNRQAPFIVIQLDSRPEEFRHFLDVAAVIRIPERRILVPDRRLQGGFLVLGKYWK